MRLPAPTRTKPRAAAALLVATGLFVTACSGGGDGTPASPPTASGAASAGGPTATPTATATFPASTLGQRMQWFVGQIDSQPVTQDLRTYFDATFLAQATPEQLYVLLGQLRTQGPWRVENVSAHDRSGTATLMSQRGQRYTLSMTVSPQGLIDGAAMRTAAAGATATTWPAVDKRLAAAASDVTVLALETDAAGRRTVVHRSGSTGLQPVSSVASLYVLAAVADGVTAGRLTWDQRLAPAPGSAPTSATPSGGTGTATTVRAAAEAMIAQGDITASDLLVKTVGEPAILAAARRAGNTHLAGITPFLTNRQVAWLAWDDSTAAKQARAQWQTADATRRRALVASAPVTGAAPAPPTSPSPHWPKGIGWFATPDDVAAALDRLDRLSRQPATTAVADILGRNRGVDVAGWNVSAFKGGSDTGVVALAFSATAGQGSSLRRQRLVVLAHDPQRAVDEATVVAGATDAGALLAR